MKMQSIIKTKLVHSIYKLLMLTFLAIMFIMPAHAQNDLQIIESTRVLSIDLDEQGEGEIVVICPTCADQNLTLQVSRRSLIRVNGENVPATSFELRPQDPSSVFYDIQSGVLKQLSVRRK